LLLLAFVAGGLAYWLKLSPVRAIAYRVEQGSVVAEVMGTGTVEARIKSLISPKISGRILSIAVDQGDRVRTGQMG
jgi:multidrug efflux pump subunit AcrA (membrane-fusion protein)